MFYAYLRGLVVFVLRVFNGNTYFHNKSKILSPEVNYIFVGPHRTFWDPVFMAFAARPKKFIFMAKKELFNNRIFGWWIRMCGAFPIDRDNPGQEAIKYPVNMLKKGDRSLIMFPSGSRHSNDVKGGVALIAKMAKVKIVPSAYAGPVSFKAFLKGDRVDMNFGDPIDVSDIKRMNEEGIAELSRRLQEAFNQLDAENDIYRKNIKKRNPFTLIYRIPLGIVAVIILLLTAIFSFFASFIWNPSRTVKKP